MLLEVWLAFDPLVCPPTNKMDERARRQLRVMRERHRGEESSWRSMRYYERGRRDDREREWQEREGGRERQRIREWGFIPSLRPLSVVLKEFLQWVEATVHEVARHTDEEYFLGNTVLYYLSPSLDLLRGGKWWKNTVYFLALYYDINAIEDLFEVLEQLVSPNWSNAQFDSNRCNGLRTKT